MNYEHIQLRRKLIKRRIFRPKRKPVTLIVGIICKDGIVMAGDSQTTWATGKTWRTNKLTELEHPYGRALIAESGAAITSAAVVEELMKLCSDRKMFDEQDMRGMSALAVRSVREKLRSQQFDCTSEEFQNFIHQEELECQLMIAHYEDGPKIDTILLSMGIANRAKSFFEASGSGSDLADYLLTDLCVPGMDCKIGSVIAVHVVEIAKRHDPFCGGPTKLGVLRLPEIKPILKPSSEEGAFGALRSYYPPPQLILSQEETDEIVQIVKEVEDKTRKQRGDFIREALREKSEKRMMEILNRTNDIIAPLPGPHSPSHIASFPQHSTSEHPH